MVNVCYIVGCVEIGCDGYVKGLFYVYVCYVISKQYSWCVEFIVVQWFVVLIIGVMFKLL